VNQGERRNGLAARVRIRRSVGHEDEAHTLNGLAQRGDAHAVRALRRHLKENEAALATARELVALKSFSHAGISDMDIRGLTNNSLLYDQ
jgi:predicted short-subunit dehydrogenase-like oxidoreductase (DUF2520 family)